MKPRILVIGSHKMVRQPSMQLYARWLAEALEEFGTVTRFQAPSIFLRSPRDMSGIAKYRFYLDQFVLLPIILFFWQVKFDAVIVSDHSSAPSALLVSSKKFIVMVHDTIAIRGALGLIPDYDRRVGWRGVLLQHLTVLALRRAVAVFANPGPLPQQLRELGIQVDIEVIGCPLDVPRLTNRPAKAPSGLDASDKFVLYVGSDGARKRKPLLIDAWRSEQLRNGPYALVLAGFTSEKNRRQFRQVLGAKVICLNDVSEAELRWLYEHCECVITASAHEGFCIPLLEAIFFRKCVITPQDRFYTDVFGRNVNAILRFDAEDGNRILRTVQDFDPLLLETSRAELLSRYSFPSFARSVRRVVESVVTGVTVRDRLTVQSNKKR